MLEGLSAQGTVDGRGFLGSKSWRGQKYHIDCWCGPYSKSSRLAAVRRIAALIRRVESDPEHARSSRLRRVECGREHTCARGTLFLNEDAVLVMLASLRKRASSPTPHDIALEESSGCCQVFLGCLCVAAAPKRHACMRAKWFKGCILSHATRSSAPLGGATSSPHDAALSTSLS